MIVSSQAQHAFARGYLSQCVPELSEISESEINDFLLHMHIWAYMGLLKLGLICAILMNNPGHVQKRVLQKLRAPVLLHPGFLTAAKEIIERVSVQLGETGNQEDEELKRELLKKGLFFVTEEKWNRDRRAHTAT